MSALTCARLHHPSRKTASIIHLGVERDTRALDLLPQQRLNCYPASPLVVLSWVFHGQLHMVQTPVDGGVEFGSFVNYHYCFSDVFL